MAKSPDAFRTIREVAEWLDTPAHVLRFWESKFTQVKPVKRAGGRRYYRPNDMLLIGGIKKLLHEDGMTIKGVQKLLRAEGVKSVAKLSQPIDQDAAPFEPVQDDGAEIIDMTAAPAAIEIPVDDTPQISAPEPEETQPETESADVAEAAPQEAEASPEIENISVNQDDVADGESTDQAPSPVEPAPEIVEAAAPDTVETDITPPLDPTPISEAPAMPEQPVSMEAETDSGEQETPEPEAPPAPAPLLTAEPLDPDPDEDTMFDGDGGSILATLLTVSKADLALKRDEIRPIYENLRALRQRMDG